jgi:molybdate transport system permease protein
MTSFPGLAALLLSFKLALVTVLVLFLIGLPLAWWLATTRRRSKPLIEALVALPLVLPPTVLGFYLLVLLGANGPLGQLWMQLTGHPLAFTFTGLVIASAIYSLPFVVQPLQTAFEQHGRRYLEAAVTLGATPFKAFFNTVLPVSRRGVLTAAVLGFAHTLGEFGVVLMVGGNIPGETRVVSIAIYDQVESLRYGDAHRLAALLLGLSFVILLGLFWFNRRQAGHA